MFSRGIRGAITVENDTVEEIGQATVEMFSKIIELNDVKIEDISHIIFTMTKDLKTAFPARFMRANFDVSYVPMMCMNELNIEPSLTKCIRVLVVVNTEKTQQEIKHVYLKGAKVFYNLLMTVKYNRKSKNITIY